jgi:hypothetical protein
MALPLLVLLSLARLALLLHSLLKGDQEGSVVT